MEKFNQTKIAPEYRFRTYLEDEVSNNAFDFQERKTLHENPKIFRTDLINGDLNDLEIGDRIAFEAKNDQDEIISCYGLKHFILMKNPIKNLLNQNCNIYIFDNHNHAFYFWHQEKLLGNIKDQSTLIHIDQHRDTRVPKYFLNHQDLGNTEGIYQYTNSTLNVGNFIPAAIETNLIEKDIIFLDSIESFNQFNAEDYKEKSQNKQLIVDIDIDVFAPELDFIDNEKKLKAIKDLLPLANTITIATSPFFIDQKLAIEWIKKIFN